MSWFPRRALAVLALAVVFAGCNGLNPTSESGNVAVNSPAPEASGKDADGQPLKLADYHGKVVMLSFWATY